MATINCALEGCTEHPTENVVSELTNGGKVKIPVCMDHVSDVGFGLEPTAPPEA